MADIRAYDPSEPEGIQRLVREALGESIRPVEPGAASPTGPNAGPGEPPSAFDLSIPTGFDQAWILPES